MAAYPKKAKVPVSRHPAFPLVVALWFAALLSLGSLAVRSTALERIVLATHIDLIVPAAAPPLGFTARIALAAALFVIGGLAGFLLGRGIARAGQAPAPSHRFAEVRQPAPTRVVNEDEDLQRLDSARAAPVAGRRRALAMQEDFAPTYYDHVPTPGGSPEILDLSVLDQIAEHVSGPEPVMVELEDEPEEHYDDYEEVAVEAPAAAAHPVPAEQAEVVEVRTFDAPEVKPEAPLAGTRPFAAPAEQAPAQTPAQATGLGLIPRDAADKLRAAPIGTLGVVELAERLAMAIARRRGESVTQTVAIEAPVPVMMPEIAPEPEPEVAAASPAPAPVFDRLLGKSAASEPAPEAPVEAAPMAMPAAMRPLQFDDMDDEPEEPILPPRRFAAPAQVAPANDESRLAPQPAAVDEQDEDEAYGSLLEMKTPARPAFVRIEEPEEEVAEIEPVVIFPGHASAESPSPAPIRRFDAPPAAGAAPRVATGSARPVDAEETERALKAALATLQRMSGAA